MALSPSRFIYTKISQYSVLLPIIIGFAYYKKLNRPFRIFLYFLVVASLVELVSSNTRWIYGNPNNRPVGHAFFLLEFIAFSLVYFLHFFEYRAIRSLIGINMIVGTAIALSDAFYINGIWNMPTVARSYFSVSIVLYVLIFLFFLFKDIRLYSWQHPMFWLSIGALLYFANNILYFILIDYLIQEEVKIEALSWGAHDAFNIIAHVLYAQSFRCFRNQKVLFS